MTEHALQAHPVMGQFGVGLLRSAPDELWSKGCLSHAVARWNIEETARAS